MGNQGARIFGRVRGSESMIVLVPGSPASARFLTVHFSLLGGALDLRLCVGSTLDLLGFSA